MQNKHSEASERRICLFNRYLAEDREAFEDLYRPVESESAAVNYTEQENEPVIKKEVAKKQAKLRAEKEERAGKINKEEEEPWLLDWKTQQMLQSSSQFQGGPKSQFTYPNAQAPRPQRSQNSYQTPTATQKPQIQKHKTYSNTQQQVQKTNQYQPKFELNPQFKNQVQY